MNNSKFYIDHLKLVPHPEGGWYRQTYKAAELITQKGLPTRYTGDRSFSTAIYYLLEKGDFSAFHRLKSDEIFHFYAGDTLEIVMISPKGELSKAALGLHSDQGETFHYAIPAGSWFAARLKPESEFALVGCTVAPGFEFEDFEMGSREKLLAEFPMHRDVIDALTRVGD
jgi:uncharacterized protein